MRAPELPATLGNPEYDAVSHMNVMTDQVSLQAAIEIFNAFNDRTIAYQRIFSIITGSVTAGLLLSQLCYWAKIKSYNEFYKTEADLSDELAMGAYELKNAKKKLVDMGFVTITRRGVPAKSYFKVNLNFIVHHISRSGKNHFLEVGKTHNWKWEKPTTTTESTTKITTESNTAGARKEIHTANFENLRSDAELPVNVKESSCHAKTQPHSLDYGKSGDVFEEDCEGRSGPHDNNLTPPTQSVNASQSVNTSNTRRKNFTNQGENSPLDELYQVGVNEMIPTAWFNIATRKNIPTDKVNDVFGKFKHFYRGREYTKIDWNEKWNRWCDNERQFKEPACQEEKPIEVVVDHSESAEVKRVRQEILRIVGDATYKSWYASCEIKLSSTNIEIIAPTKFNMGWIETNGKNLDSPLRASLGKNVVYKYKQQNTSREARMAS